MLKDSKLNLFDQQFSKCVVCESTSIVLWKKKENNGIIYDIYRCLDCQSGFLNPRPTLDWLKSIYTKSGHGLAKPITLREVLHHESEFPNTTIDAERLVGCSVQYLPKRKEYTALDIGSGYGFYSAAALKYGFEVTAINPSVWENNVFESMNGFRPIESFFEETELYGQSNKFDLVIMSQVLEHIYNPALFLAYVTRLLKPGGIIVLAVPNFNSIRVTLLGTRDNSCLWVPEHLNYFTYNGISRLLERMDFTKVQHCQVSRIPFYSLANRLSLTGKRRYLTNLIVKYLQVLPIIGCNSIGKGFYLNMWAQCKKKVE